MGVTEEFGRNQGCEPSSVVLRGGGAVAQWLKNPTAVLQWLWKRGLDLGLAKWDKGCHSPAVAR